MPEPIECMSCEKIIQDTEEAIREEDGYLCQECIKWGNEEAEAARH